VKTPLATDASAFSRSCELPDERQGCGNGAGRSDGKVIVQAEVLDGGLGEVAVIDIGLGIPGRRLGALFDNFYATKQDAAGLGLSIARAMSKAMGIGASCKAAFRLALPMVRRSC
jgi:signal transduction histidine kinase